MVLTYSAARKYTARLLVTPGSHCPIAEERMFSQNTAEYLHQRANISDISEIYSYILVNVITRVIVSSSATQICTPTEQPT